jgi:GNAT superfamily N-acetyltransferase
VNGDTDIRPAKPSDLFALTAVLGQRDFFEDLLGGEPTGTRLLLVAWHDGVPVGDVAIDLAGSDHPVIRERMPHPPIVYHLEVTPALQRRGIGTALLRAAEEQARLRDHAMVALLVEVDNPDAIRLYRAAGYVDWDQGTVEHEWAAVRPDGSRRTVRQTCHVLVKLVAEGVPGLDAWDAWQPREAALRLAGLHVPWHVAAGWALDLWHGRQTREHGDLEIAISRADLRPVRAHLIDAGYDLYMASGPVRPLTHDVELPDDRHQVWVCEPAVPAWRMDIFCEPRDGDMWVCRRDERIREPYARVVATTDDGIPYLRPEAVLLFKARHSRARDEADFERALPRLDADARAWLGRALDLVHPGHRWLARLRDGSAGEDAP